MTEHHMTYKNNTLLIATHNQGKWKEFQDVFKEYDIRIISARDMSLTEPEETGTTFVENAALKAITAAQKSGHTALGDDSGLAIDALNGAPGIFSARWAGPDKNFNIAMDKIKQKLTTKIYHKPRAQFICVLCLAMPNGYHETFTGTVQGHLVWPPRGKYGFGYDPIFVPQGHTHTFAQMPPGEKKISSHRILAINQLLNHYFPKMEKCKI